MAFCEFCKAEGKKTGTCAYCGTVYYTAGVTSAATFVKMTEQQFIAAPISGVATVQQPTSAQTAQQPVYQQPPVQPVQPQPVEPVYQPVYQEPSVPSVNASAWQSAWNTPVNVTPVEEKKVNQVMCYTCGSMNNEGARFCSKCGTQLQAEPEDPATSPIDAWKNRW